MGGGVSGVWTLHSNSDKVAFLNEVPSFSMSNIIFFIHRSRAKSRFYYNMVYTIPCEDRQMARKGGFGNPSQILQELLLFLMLPPIMKVVPLWHIMNLSYKTRQYFQGEGRSWRESTKF